MSGLRQNLLKLGIQKNEKEQKKQVTNVADVVNFTVSGTKMHLEIGVAHASVLDITASTFHAMVFNKIVTDTLLIGITLCLAFFFGMNIFHVSVVFWLMGVFITNISLNKKKHQSLGR